MDVKKIDWSEEMSGDEKIRYDHVIGVSPLGNYLITWKGWKKFPSYSLEHEIFGYSGDYISLESAKDDAQNRFNSTVLNCITNRVEVNREE